MRDFFVERSRTRDLFRGVLEVRRGLNPAENNAQRKNNHFD